MTAEWHLFMRFMDWFCLKGVGYQFWSGIGLAMFFPIVYYWHHTCHKPTCLRIGHPDPEHGHPVCRTHQDKL